MVSYFKNPGFDPENPSAEGSPPRIASRETWSARYSSLFFIAFLVFVLDQATKICVLLLMPLYSIEVIIPGFFNLAHVHNTGAAFSFLAGDSSLLRQAFFIGMNLTAMGVIFYIYSHFRKEEYLQRRALALILGGALGNLADRLRMGEVVDFLDFYIGNYHWPAFNVADSAITIGSLILLYSLLRSPR